MQVIKNVLRSMSFSHP